MQNNKLKMMKNKIEKELRLKNPPSYNRRENGLATALIHWFTRRGYLWLYKGALGFEGKAKRLIYPSLGFLLLQETSLSTRAA
jgi:hypothetical protein